MPRPDWLAIPSCHPGWMGLGYGELKEDGLGLAMFVDTDRERVDGTQVTLLGGSINLIKLAVELRRPLDSTQYFA